jgi:hypothetical protein
MPFEWMLGEAAKAELHVNDQGLQKVLHRSTPPESPWAEPQHESLTLGWWPAEFFPKWQFQRATGRRALRIGLGRHRFIPDKVSAQ